ncbi:MAG: YbhN family protein [Candidatus Thorarchaeota archaeon]
MKQRDFMRHSIRLIGIIIFILLLVSIDFNQVIYIMSTLDASFVLLAALLVLPVMLLKGARWYIITSSLGLHLSVSEAVDGLCIAQMMSFALPGSLGDLVRVPFLKCRGNTTERSIMSVFLDAIAASIVPYFITTMALIQILDISYILALAIIISVGIFILASYTTYRVLKFLFSPWLMKARIRRLKKKGISGRPSVPISHSFRTAGWESLALAIAVAGGAWLLYTIQGVMLAQALGIQLPWLSIALAVTLTAMFVSVPISIQGIGVREGVLLLVLGAMGIDYEIVITFSVILMAISLTPSVWGLASWLRDPFIRIKEDAIENAILEPSVFVD